MVKTISVLLADDTDVSIFGLKSIFDTTKEITVIGSTQSVYEIPRMVANLVPDVLILDLKWYQDEVAGWMVIKDLREMSMPVRIIAITAYENLMQAAWREGADAVIAKTYSREQLISLVKSVYANEYSVRPRRMVDLQPIQEDLTKRELEVLDLLLKGLSNKEISDSLFVSVNTAKNHVKNICEKLGVENRHKAVAKAIELGLLE